MFRTAKKVTLDSFESSLIKKFPYKKFYNWLDKNFKIFLKIFLAFLGKKLHFLAIFNFYRPPGKKCILQKWFRISFWSFWAIIKVRSLKNSWFQNFFEEFFGHLWGKKSRFWTFFNFSRPPGKKCILQKWFRILFRSFWAIMKVCSLKNSWKWIGRF